MRGQKKKKPVKITPANDFIPPKSVHSVYDKYHHAKIRNMTKAEISRVCNILLRASVAELRQIHASKDSAGVDAVVAGVLLQARETGDMTKFDKLLDRVIGKVTEETRMEVVNPIIPPQVIVTLPSNGREALPEKSQEIKVDLGFDDIAS